MTESKIKLDFYMIKTTLYFINIIQNISYAQYLNNNRVKIEKYQPNIKKKKKNACYQFVKICLARKGFLK